MKTTKIRRAKQETSRYGAFREKEADAGIIKSQEAKRQKWLNTAKCW